MIRILQVALFEEYNVRLTLTDGSVKDVDLEPFLRGPVFQPIRENSDLFRNIRVDPQHGTVVWENSADIDPDVLICDRTPAAWTSDPTRVT